MSRLRAGAARIAAALPTRESALLTAGFFGGLAAVAAGVALIYLPAGIITAGALAAAVAYLYARQPVPVSPS